MNRNYSNSQINLDQTYLRDDQSHFSFHTVNTNTTLGG